MNDDAALLQALFRAIPDMVWLKDIDGRYLACNPAFERYYGQMAEAILGHTDFDFVDADTAAFYRRKDAEAAAAGVPRRNEEWIVYPDGARRLIETTKTPLHTGNGQLLGVLGIARDITERKQAEEAALDQQARLRALLDSFPFPVWMKDADCRFVAVNRAVALLTGHADPAALIGHEDLDFFPPDLCARYRADDLAVLRDGLPRQVEEPIEARGERRWFETLKFPAFGTDDRVIGTVGYARDVTVRRDAEERLRAYERDYRHFFEDGRVAMLLVDPADGSIVDANHAAAIFYGWSRPQLLGLNLSGLSMLPAGALASRIEEAVAAAQTHFLCRHRRADGSEPDVEVHAAPVRARGRSLLYLIVHDVTERVALQSALADSEARYRLLFENMHELLFDIAPDATVRLLNPAWTTITGHPLSATLGTDFRTWLHPDDRSPASRLFFELSAGRRERATIELRVRTADGGWRWLQTEGNPTRDAAGHITGIGGVAVDVSERREAEQRLRLAASVFDHAHEGIIITDAAGTILEVNRAFTELTGWTRDEILGENPRVFRSGRQNAAFYDRMWSTLAERGWWRGEVWNRRKDGSLYAELLDISAVHDSAGCLTHYVGVFTDITLLKEHQQRLEDLVHHDPLTGLPNRVLLADRLAHAMAQADRAGTRLAVCYLDLDGFKPVNDTWGHETGDRLLIEIAQRLLGCVRAGDTVARLGGDEFVLLLGGLPERDDCTGALPRLQAAVCTPCVLDGRVLAVSASIGVTVYPDDASDADTLLRHADQAMYSAKQAGRNGFHLFDADQERRARDRSELIGRVHAGIPAGEFELHYQPEVDMQGGGVAGVEALLRWRPAGQPLLSPAAFLPAIEASPAEIALGEWVLDSAIAQLERWHGAGLALTVAVNVSAHHLQHPGFVARLAQRLRTQPHVPGRLLRIEVLENAALGDVARVRQIIADCRALGVGCALDDFGTGYSSLTHLRRLPADVVKIDQSFIRDMLDDSDDLAIVEGVIGLARAFDRRVVAEGVETAEHGAVLLAFGCTHAQGYGIARPMPADALPDWLARWQPPALWQHHAARWTRAELPLLGARIELQRWIERLGTCLDLPPGEIGNTPAFGTHDCRFGRWYHGPGRQRYGTHPAWAKIDAGHEEFHALGAELLAMHLAGEAEAARARLGELRTQCDALLGLLDALLGSPEREHTDSP